MSAAPKALWQAGHLRARLCSIESTQGRQKAWKHRVRTVVFSRSRQTLQQIFARSSRMVARSAAESASLEAGSAAPRGALRTLASSAWHRCSTFSACPRRAASPAARSASVEEARSALPSRFAREARSAAASARASSASLFAAAKRLRSAPDLEAASAAERAKRPSCRPDDARRRSSASCACSRFFKRDFISNMTYSALWTLSANEMEWLRSTSAWN
mmetsp:Transcript_17354/g.58630  ORF Transcript_17354/g.58630 Transcript_17354/m.58630 type:complete len:217 (-) Transcript_17354:842-1492(-)